MNYRKSLILLSLLWLSLLSACSTASTPEAGQVSSTGSQTAGQTGEIQLSTRLLLGTFQLEDTGLAVDAAQASQLLPLWKAVKSLSNSDSTSSVEMEALYQQIQETMTADQLKAIEGFSIDADSMRSLMSDLGLEMGAGRNVNAAGDSSAQAARQMGAEFGGPGGPGGGMPMGGVPGEMGGAGLRNQSDNTVNSSTTARQTTGANFMETMLLDPLIKLLQERANS
jgi:hypothetical protein